MILPIQNLHNGRLLIGRPIHVNYFRINKKLLDEVLDICPEESQEEFLISDLDLISAVLYK